MGGLRHIFVVIVAIASLASCKAVSNLVHDDEIAARIGKRVLTRSQLESFIPKGISPEDSLNLARQYVESWAKEQLFLDMAESKLSKSELDVSKELEDYRRSLLKFRYEQQYINDRLDTNVTRTEIEDYYEAHKEMFVLEIPAVKARFLDIMKESPDIEALKKKMSSSDYSDLSEADSIAYKSALRYEDHSDEWMDMVSYARLFGEDYGTLLSKLKPDGFIEISDEKGDVKIGFVCDMQKPGKPASIDYCATRIKDIIISNRKHVLMSTLERDLLDDALENDRLIIY